VSKTNRTKFILIFLVLSVTILSGCDKNIEEYVRNAIGDKTDGATINPYLFKIDSVVLNSERASDSDLQVYYNADVTSLNISGEFKGLESVKLWSNSSCTAGSFSVTTAIGSSAVSISGISPPLTADQQEIFFSYSESGTNTERCYEKPLKINLKKSLSELKVSIEAPFSALEANVSPRLVTGKLENSETARIYLSADCSGNSQHQVSWQDFGSLSFLIQNPLTLPEGKNPVSVLQSDSYGNSFCYSLGDYIARPFRTLTKVVSTEKAFAALRSDGSVIAWGDPDIGGSISGVLNLLDGTVDVVDIVGGQYAFAALRNDGRVITWGYEYQTAYTASVSSAINGSIPVTQIYSTKSGSFAALRSDGSVVTWGNVTSLGVSSPVDGTVDALQIKAYNKIGVIRTDGSFISFGPNASAVANELSGGNPITDYVSSAIASAVIRSDGSVVTWGDAGSGGNSSAVAGQLNGSVDITQVVPVTYAMAALKADGSIVTWGSSTFGGDTGNATGSLSNITKLYGNYATYAALKSDGSVVCWGFSGSGSPCGGSAVDGTIPVVKIFTTEFGFAALRSDGSVTSWGNSSDQSSVSSLLDGTIDVIDVITSSGAYAALRADGSVVTWGNPNIGGDSSLVSSEIDGTIDVISITATKESFAALRSDGKVITWGSWSMGGENHNQKKILNSSNPVRKISLSDNITAVTFSDGSVSAWGFGSTSGGVISVSNELNGTIPVTNLKTQYYMMVSLRSDGSLIYSGPDTPSSLYTTFSSVKNQMDGTIDVVEVVTTLSGAFAARRADGSVIVWGSHNSGGDASSQSLSSATPSTKVVGGFSTFAALKSNGSVTFWGRESYCSPRIEFSAVAGSLNGSIPVTDIVSNQDGGWAALRSNGSVITWGCYGSGSDSSAVSSQINGTNKVVKIFTADKLFSSYIWQLGFIALREDGSLVVWGGGAFTGTLPSEVNGTIDVSKVFTNGVSFAAIRSDGSALSWDSSGTITSSSVSQAISGSVDEIVVNAGAFAALRSDGSVITWGSATGGGDSSSVASKLDGTIDVVKIYPNGEAFAALRADGSVVTWGKAADGGDSSKVAGQLNGLIDVVEIASYYELDAMFPFRKAGGSFVAVRSDGSMVEWGSHQRLGLPNINP
jgi:alpha-tubulin suppressor-like RCC1 family protein